MTGYGMAEGPLQGGRLVVEVRTVNHRHFNTQFRLPSVLQRCEADLRNRLKERLERGHVALQARWTEEPPRAGAIRVDIERARAVVAALLELKEVLGLSGDVDLEFVARQPDVLTTPQEHEGEIDSGVFLGLVDQAVDGVLDMRDREGAALGRAVAGHLATIESRLAEVEAQAPQRVMAERDRLRAAVAELLDGQQLDEARLQQEIALLADRLDVNEEIVRLKTHLAAAHEALAGRGAVGRQLSFLGQEMLREINTIGSKANDASITHAVIAMKGELEKFREQVENLE